MTSDIGLPTSKTAVKKLLVAERQAMRKKQKLSEFMRRTLSQYKGMAARAMDLRNQELPFSIGSFRVWAETELDYGCRYCGCRLTVKSMTPDHSEPVVRGGSFGLDNVVMCCKQCNWRKGQMDGEQFRSLITWVDEHLVEPEKSDFWRRLTIGGKWGVRVG